MALPPIPLLAGILNDSLPRYPMAFLDGIFEISYEFGHDVCRSVLNELELETKLPKWFSWNDQVVKKKRELIQLGVSLGCKGVIFYNSCAQIFANESIESNLLTLSSISGDRLLFRFCFDMLSALLDPKATHRKAALKDLEEIAVDPSISSLEIGNMIKLLSFIRQGNDIFPCDRNNLTLRWDCVEMLCNAWRKDNMNHVNFWTNKKAKDLPNCPCPKCKVLIIIVSFDKHPRQPM